TVVSTVGAGDSFGAVFLARYLTGVEVTRALGEAAAVASFVVSNQDSIPEGWEEYIAKICG
ncbi:MAG: carbohydrate kinase, partial [Clostridia bacterium]|nr:carbohydrate kinase [Clostridia bacterium]